MPIKLKSDVSSNQIVKNNNITVYLDKQNLTTGDKKEFLANEKYEMNLGLSKGQILFNDIVSKSDFIRTFYKFMDFLKLTENQKILELGSSHGWASAILKARFPNCYVVASDLVDECLIHASGYEQLLEARIDEKWAFNCRHIPFADNQFDLIFTFASFHHFFNGKGNYEQSLKEIVRVLKPGGRAVFLYEPSSPAYLYPLAYKRVNKRQITEEVDEDLLVKSRLTSYCKSIDVRISFDLVPFYFHRNPLPTIYYFILSKIPFLKQLLPCTVNVSILKNDKSLPALKNKKAA